MGHPLSKAANFRFTLLQGSGQWSRNPVTQEWIQTGATESNYTGIVRVDSRKTAELIGKPGTILYIKGNLIEPKQQPNIQIQSIYKAEFYDPFTQVWTEGEFMPWLILQAPFAVVSRIMGHSIEGVFSYGSFET